MQFILLITLIIIKLISNKISFANGIHCGNEQYSIYHSHMNATCYEHRDSDDLPLLDEDHMPEEAIFFIDTSCKGGLNAREACSVEAAARTNPGRLVTVLFAGPVSEHCVQSEPLVGLLSYNNIRLNRIYVTEFARGTGLDALLNSSIINSGPYPVLYALDLLKFVTLYKFSGIYMDLDMMATRPFDDLPHGSDWASIADHAREALSTAVIAASSHNIGNKFINTIIRVLQEVPSVDAWSFGHIWVMKEAVQRLCGVIPFNRTKPGFSFSCKGLVLYTSKFFFPIPCYSSKDYFDSKLDINILTNSITQQLCNGLTFQEVITKNSTYAKLMVKFCPKVYKFLNNSDFNERPL